MAASNYPPSEAALIIVEGEVVENTRQCSVCKITKLLSEFARRKNRRSGRFCYCKECANKAKAKWKKDNPEKDIASRRKSMLKKRYGLTLEQYDKMFEEQGCGCAICGEVNKSGYRLAVDHNHNTGKIRALLCQNCNRKIGEIENDPGLFDKLVIYLHNHSSLTSE